MSFCKRVPKFNWSVVTLEEAFLDKDHWFPYAEAVDHVQTRKAICLVSHLVATGTFFLPGDSPPNPLVKV
jgi:hypothetical protein